MPHISFDDISIFVSVARRGSFISAAKALSLPASTVSRRIAVLEARLGTQLIRRTTRTISLTEDGRAFMERCAPAIGEIEAASSSLSENNHRLRGTLRVSAPHYVCPDTLGSWLLDFAALHPDLKIDLRWTNTTPDLIEEGIDLSFQVGPLRDGRNVARRLWSLKYVLCAARPFIAKYPGVSKASHPKDLESFPCVVTPPLVTWQFARAGERSLSFAPRLIAAHSDDWRIGAEAVKRGMGLGYLPEALVGPVLGDALVAVNLGNWRPQVREVFAVYPASRQLSPKIRAAIEFALKGRAAHGAPGGDHDSMASNKSAA